MRKLREILRLGLVCGLSGRQIARSVSVSRPTVSHYLDRAIQEGFTRETVNSLSEADLEKLLATKELGRPRQDRTLPDWEHVHRELARKSVTLQLLWEEHKQTHPDGYRYSQFCSLYRAWRKHLDLSMRQTHKAGEKLFVDYAGQTVPIHDPVTGRVSYAQIFVAVLGLSNCTYAEASADQGLSSWIMSHVRAFEYFGGVTAAVVSDNLKSGVSKPCRYEPDLNPAYQDFASHYATAVLPTRVRHPKDKSKVEVGVQVVERWILAALRNRKFFSIEELNEFIRQHLQILNTRPFKKLKGSRKDWFDLLEKPALKPLPPTRYAYADWKKATVNIDYHVELKGHYYSVPHAYRGRQVDIRHTPSTVEIFLSSSRVASHVRSHRLGSHTTVAEHMPKSHRSHLEWTPSRIVSWAGAIGPYVRQMCESILAARPHPEQGYRSCLGIIRLDKRFGTDRLESACKRACELGSFRYKSVRSILECGLDKTPIETPAGELLIRHDNIRGEAFYRRSVSQAAHETPRLGPSTASFSDPTP
jgi:transposase